MRAPESRTMITLEVVRREQVSPSFASVTLGGEALEDFIAVGADQTVRLFFPRDGQPRLRMPTRSSEAWMAEMIILPKTVRPWVRTLTIRRTRPGEVDIEFALHGDSPMTQWVERVKPGSPAGIFDMGTTYLPPDGVGWQLFAADESAVPAAKAILDGAPHWLKAEAFLEVPTTADVPVTPPSWPAGVRVHWLPRDDPARRPGELVLDAVRRATLPSGRFYTWVAGEARLPTSLRRHLVADRGARKPDISFTGYWRYGHSSPG
ncbi:siderophore-interacting protein [Amycolatopsis jejuensis]|uniref:siderophore-interacting protein n=1 Tax=Amycolatopsis jejuensis TaxID=330084 RepID=UPI001FDEB489|nr:siderophore-interacting protein [Amycolatopsis jejuensis]